MSLVRGVLVAGRFRNQHQLNTVSADDQRNILIVELTGRTNQPVGHYQAMNDDILAGAGALLVFLREGKIRTDAQIKTMSDDDMRNTVIVEVVSLTNDTIPELQGLSNIELVLYGLGKRDFGAALAPGTYQLGVLMMGNFLDFHSLKKMSDNDIRNTLIFEINKFTKASVPELQGLNDFDLGGAGALYMFIKRAGIRKDAEIKGLTIDDLRNIMIVEMDGQTHLGKRLQGLRNMDLVRLGLGVDPSKVFPNLPPPLHPPHPIFRFSIDSFEILTQKSDGDHSDSDWLTLVVNVVNLDTKNNQTFASPARRIEGSIKTGDIIRGLWESEEFEVGARDSVVVTYFLANLGSTRAEDQFAQAVKITDKVVQVVAPIVGAIIGAIKGDIQKGLEIGEQIAEGFDKAIKAFSDLFDLVGIHVAPPNCNGEVLHDSFMYLRDEITNATGQRASRQYTGPQDNERCGAAPVTKVNFTVLSREEF